MTISPPSIVKSAGPGDTRARIVEAARRCFDRHGFAKTRMDDIAREAGTSRPTIYNYFAGKEEIIDHIGFEELELINSAVRARIGWHDSFADLATEALVAAVLVSQTNQYIRRFVEALDPDRSDEAPTAAFRTEARIRWRRILGRARAANELAPDLEIDVVVGWVCQNLVGLLKSFEREGHQEDYLRFVARRLVIEPLLADRMATSEP